MGFGNMLNNAKSVVSEGSNGQRMPNVFLDIKEGSRTFRCIPDPSNPSEPMQGEIVWSVWIPVIKDGARTERRVFIDDSARPLLAEYDSVMKLGEREALSRKVKLRFFLNVFDRSRVIKLPEGDLIYANHLNEYWKKEGTGLKRITDIRPEPNNSIMVLEGSVSARSDRRGGLLNDIDDLSKTVWEEVPVFEKDENGKPTSIPAVDSKGMPITELVLMPITKVDIELKTSGTGLATKRTVSAGINREPLPHQVLALPLYDLKSFTRPWSVDAIRSLLDGMDYGEVMKQHKYQYVPQLLTDDIF
jgi:hypothetical protein